MSASAATGPNADPRPFLTVVAWPEGMDRAAASRLLATAIGHGQADVRLRLRHQPPFIYGQVPPDAAARAVAAVNRAGGDAFATTFADLAALGPTLRIRDLGFDERGNIALELWDGISTTIRRADVRLLVRAHLRVKGRLDRAEIESRGRDIARQRAMVVHLGLGTGPGALAAGVAAAAMAADAVGRTTPVSSSDKLDIHTRDGAIYQIDGDKFGYRVLGDLRRHGDKANMDAMFELLAHVTPDEIADDYFALWKAPPGCQRLRLPGPRPENIEFAFYSRWAALMYRHLLGSS